MKAIKRKMMGGFSLIELMIVVAIIGVLATIAVPSFRIMVQRAKKSEAKTMLGGLYTSQSAFLAEYGTYGNRLDKLGFMVEGNANNRIYTVGFPTATCANPAATLPDVTTSQGAALNLSYPQYYSAAGPVYAYNAGKLPGSCQAASVAKDGTTYTATATGLLPNNLPAGSNATDTWTIDQNRDLINVKDGIQ